MQTSSNNPCVVNVLNNQYWQSKRTTVSSVEKLAEALNEFCLQIWASTTNMFKTKCLFLFRSRVRTADSPSWHYEGWLVKLVSLFAAGVAEEYSGHADEPVPPYAGILHPCLNDGSLKSPICADFERRHQGYVFQQIVSTHTVWEVFRRHANLCFQN